MDNLSSRPNYWLLLVFLVGVVGGGALIGVLIETEWYGQLIKPSFAPPPWLFGPVWTALYILIAIAGWRVWTRSGAQSLRGLWLLQMVLNFCWTPVFFGLQMIGLALIIIIAILAVIILFIWRAWQVEWVSSILFIPYMLWVAFASALTIGIFSLN